MSQQQITQYFTVGLTGGLASGKSTCSEIFEQLGASIHDADVIARSLLEPTQPGWHACIERFGHKILKENKKIDRKQLRQHIFSNKQDKEWLESLLHPQIRETLITATKQPTNTYHILVIPLLFESNFNYPINRSCLVISERSIQKQRALDRDGSNAPIIDQMLASQMNNEQKQILADDVIDNNSDLTSLRKRVETLHQFYLKQAT